MNSPWTLLSSLPGRHPIRNLPMNRLRPLRAQYQLTGSQKWRPIPPWWSEAFNAPNRSVEVRVKLAREE